MLTDLRRTVARLLVLPLVAGLTLGLAPAAVAAPPVAADRSIPVSPAAVQSDPLPRLKEHVPGVVTWPSPGSAEVDIPPANAGRAATGVVVGGLPVTLSPVTGDVLSRQGMSAESAPSRVRIEVLDRAVAQRGGAPVAFKLSRADGGTGSAKVHVQVDFNKFRHAFGGAYASRVELRLVPECGLSAVSEDQARRGACAGVALDSVNNFKAGVVSAVVDLGTPLAGLAAPSKSPKQQALIGQESPGAASAAPSGGAVVMMTSGSQANGVGTFGKTNLKESGTWSHSGASGNFGHNYPLTVPPVAGSLAPKLSLDYSSASVDGQTAAEHIQNGPLGEGWSLTGGGFIESTFRPCSVDQDHSPTWTNINGDPCWRHENYQLSWAGRSGELVPTSTANTWRVASDDGAKVEFLGAEGFWRITTTDGTQWYFGRQRLPGWTSGARETGSVLTQEVFANHSGEPCFHGSGYVYSHCTKPYRWLLDHVVDVNGNSMSYWYSRFTNLAGSNLSGQSVFTYHRDAVLERIEYGTRVGNETTATPPAKVEFTNSDRCVAADCNPNVNWPDTPWDLKCDAAPCNNNLSPSYWTTKRLTKITSKIWTGAGTDYKPVDEWSFVQQFPGGTDVPTLWLESITRKGYDASGVSTTMPALTTHGRIDRNRADYDPNAGMADPQKYRIDYLDTETGGRIEVSYLPANEPACTWSSGKPESAWPNYNHNASRCFQQWVTNRSGQTGWSWWHKFVVDKVTEKDRVGGSPDKVTSYQYTMDGATSNHPLVLWGYSSSVWASPKKAMSSWKGYPTVITTIGAAGQTQSKTKRVYYRGLDRDTGLNLPGEEFFRTSNVVNSEGTSVVDHPALGGQVREVIVYDGATGPEISKTITTQSVIATTAGGTLPTWQTPPERHSYLTRETATKTLTKIADGTWRATESLSTWDSTFGTQTQLNNLGQTNPTLSSDDLCTRYTYARNTNDLTLRLGSGSGLVQATGNVVATDWSAYDFVFSPGDFNGDGKADVLARNSLTTNLYMFTGNGSGGFSAGPTEVGWGWTDMDVIFSPGDFSGDGKPDVLFRRPSTTNLYMIRGNGTGGWIDITEVGWGWTDMDRIFSPGDLTGDSKVDVLFRRPSTGNLYYLAGNGASSWTGAITQIGAGSWAGKNAFFGKGDVTGDGKTDLYMTESATGNLHLYPGTGTGGLGSPTLVGSGWNDYQHLLTAGDITADGKADIFAVYGGARITGAVSRAETVGVSCGTTAAYPADLISDHRTFYDANATHGSVPMKGLPTKSEEAKSHNGTSPSYIATGETGYDQWGRPLWTKDVLGNQTDTLYTHNSAGLQSAIKLTAPPATTGATRHAVTTSIDVLRGVPETVTDANGKVTSATYDPLGRLKTVREPGNTGTYPDVEYTYSISGTAVPHLLTKNLGPNGNQIVSYEIFDGLLRPRQTQTTAPDGKRVITDISYDSRGLTAKASVFYNNASGPNSTLVWPTNGDADIDTQTRYVYDGAARPTFQQVYKQGAKLYETETRYGGDRTGVIPPTGGIATQNVFDARGQIVEKRQFSGTPFTGAFDKTSYTYDRAGRLLTVKDPATNTWTYEYDLLGRKTKTIDPDTGTSTATYDNAGQVLSSTDSRAQAIFYEYDNLGRKTKQRADTVGGPVMSDWVYDTVAKGQLTSTSRFDGATTYTSAVGSYDDGYRPLSATETVPGFGTGGGNLTYTSTFTYKTNGAPATTVLPGVGGLPAETLSYTYTDQGLPKTLTSGQATYVADMTYTYDGMLAEQLLGAAGKQVKQTNVFDAATRRLASADTLLESSPSVFTSKYTSEFAYNNAGLITSIAGKTNGSRDQVECFKYDHLQRLDEAWTNNAWDCDAAPVAGGAGADPYWRKWTFDLVGNRLTQTDKGASADTTWTYQVGAAGAVKPHQVKKVDATGPLAGTATRTFSYDAAGNMLSRSTEAGVAQTLTWDKEGHLATLTEGSVATSYVYDSSGRRLIAKNSAKQTLYLPDGTELEKIGSADPLGTRYYNGVAVRSASGLKWIASNHQQSSTVQIDSVTLAAERRRFMPYGEPRGGQPSGWLGTKGFVGGTKDDTGLTHLGAREYDPTLGRFISRDPIMDLNDPQQIHGYAYANNNPTTWSDSSGLIVTGDNEGLLTAVKNNNGSYTVSDKRPPASANESGGGGGGPSEDPAAAAKKAAEEAKQKLIDAAKALLKIAMDELGITAALDCFTKGDLGACAETALNVAMSFVGGLAGKLLAKYGAPWKWAKGAELVKKVWNLLERVVSGVRDWIKNSRLARSLGDCATSPNSFVAGTLVLLADGSTKRIEDVEVGDVVVATDPATGRSEAKPVKATIVGQGSKNLVEITIDVDGRAGSATAAIVATDEHPFWAPSAREWVYATDLQAGTVLEMTDRTRVKVAAVSRWSETATVYNLSISDIHTYYVVAGNTPVLVHNCGGPVQLSDDVIDTHILPLHGPGSPATGTKFHDGIDPDDFGSLANEAVSGSPIPSRVDPVTGNHAHDHDFGPGRVIGENGSTWLRVWVDPNRNVRTMHPL